MDDERMTAAAACYPNHRVFATLLPDARALRRARRVVHESCVRSKVGSELADDAMGVAAELVSEMVAHDGGPLQLDVEANPEEVTVRVRDEAGHESTAHVHEDEWGRTA